MNIVVSQELVDGYQTTLSDYKTALERTVERLALSEQQADLNQFLTIEQTCNLLSVTPETLIYYRKYGLEYYKKGREGVWYRKGDILDWLATGKVNRR